MGYSECEDLSAIKEKRSPRHIWRIAFFGLLFLAGAYVQLNSSVKEWNDINQRSTGNICAQPSPAAKRSNYSSAYDSAEFKRRSAERLSGAVKIPTMCVHLVERRL